MKTKIESLSNKSAWANVLLISFFIIFLNQNSYAQEPISDSVDFVRLIQPKIQSQVWINPGMFTYHLQKDQNLNGVNWGAGFEYRFNTVASMTVGHYYNSYRAGSNYVGIYYQPVVIGPIKLGAVFGAVNGYPQTNNGGWFPAALPALTWEGDLFGANLFFLPNIGTQIEGIVSLQMKLKVWE